MSLNIPSWELCLTGGTTPYCREGQERDNNFITLAAAAQLVLLLHVISPMHSGAMEKLLDNNSKQVHLELTRIKSTWVTFIQTNVRRISTCHLFSEFPHGEGRMAWWFNGDHGKAETVAMHVLRHNIWSWASLKTCSLDWPTSLVLCFG